MRGEEQKMPAMKYVVHGDADSGLAVHRPHDDDPHRAACGTFPISSIMGPGWWYDRQARTFKQMVGIPVNQKITCGRNGCRE